MFARVKRGRERKGVEDVSTIREREREREGGREGERGVCVVDRKLLWLCRVTRELPSLT